MPRLASVIVSSRGGLMPGQEAVNHTHEQRHIRKRCLGTASLVCCMLILLLSTLMPHDSEGLHTRVSSPDRAVAKYKV